MIRDQAVDTPLVRAWIAGFAERISRNRELLTELDAAIGDADHGLNMDRGMVAVLDALAASTAKTPSELFTVTGRTLVSNVGGASGPLYGTLFLRMGLSAAGTDRLDAPTFAQVLRAGLVGVTDRGKAAPGDKTMVDALAPASDALDEAVARAECLAEALRAATEAATAGRDRTEQMVARRGRASYLGDRSLGHQDPGAASATMLIEAAAAVLAQDRPTDDRTEHHHHTSEMN